MAKELRLAYEIPMKGVLRIPNSKQVANITKITLVKYNHGGSLFAAVTGKVVQIFSNYSTIDGLPTREHILAGHSSDVSSVVWTNQDLRLFSVSKEGICEWEIGKPTRLRDNFLKNHRYHGLAVSRNGTLASSVVNEDFASTAAGAVSLCVWQTTTSIEQPGIHVPLDESVTCILMTQTPTTDHNKDIVQNLLIAGTEKGGLVVAELKDLCEEKAGGEASALVGNRVLHSGRITAMTMSVDSTWLFTASEGGVLVVSKIEVRKGDSISDSRSTGLDSNEPLLTDESVTVAERVVLLGYDSRLQQLQSDLMEQQSINNYQIEVVTQEREKVRGGRTHSFFLKKKEKIWDLRI